MTNAIAAIMQFYSIECAVKPLDKRTCEISNLEDISAINVLSHYGYSVQITPTSLLVKTYS